MKTYLLLIAALLSASCSSFPAENKGPRRILLTEKNTVVLSGPVNTLSAAMVNAELIRLDAELPANIPIILVLRTPGGSVFDGLAIIQVAKSLDREVKTLVFEAASMGFMIAQHLGERLIIDTGIVMSHRVSGRCGGNMTEIDRCRHMIDRLDVLLGTVAANRLKMSFEDYMKMIHEEKWWIGGASAIAGGAADRLVIPKCNKVLLQAGTCPMI